MTKRIAIAAVLLGFLFMATIGSVVSTERHVRRYLGMPDYVGVIPEHVNAAIMRQLRQGSSRDEVESYLSSRGIGKDGASICKVAPGVGQIDCRLATDHHLWELLRVDYTIAFEFDTSGKLRDVSARSAFSRL